MNHQAQLASFIRLFETPSREDVHRLREFYTGDAYFKDPFNEVRGLPQIQRIFSHMFRELDAPRFAVRGKVVQGAEAFLVWDMLFRFRGGAQEQRIHGVNHLRFDPDGKVIYHRDYWDAAEELYAKLPLVGVLMRWLKRRVG